MIKPATSKAYAAINVVADALVAKGIHLPEAYKRRDPREPGRVEKEIFEDKLAKQFELHFAGQRERLEKHIRSTYLARKAKPKVPGGIFSDEEIEAAILVILIAMAQHGITLFGGQVNLVGTYYSDKEWLVCGSGF